MRLSTATTSFHRGCCGEIPSNLCARANAAAAVAQGLVSVNYLPCEKPDRAVAPGDVLSLRGKGKVTVGEPGGKTRKDRQFITVELWTDAPEKR